MKPETHEKWEKALSHIKNAEGLLKDGKLNEAEKQASLASWFAFEAVMKLSKELEMPDLSVIAWNEFHACCERVEKGHYTPKENVEWYSGVLKRFTAELPPDTLRPFK